MSFRVLTPDGEEGAQWESIVLSLPVEMRDLHFLPAYGRIYRRTYGHTPFLALLERERSIVLQPFVKRSLNNLPFLADEATTRFFDIANAYGFGGPLCIAMSGRDVNDLVSNFEEGLMSYGLEQGFASEFASLHPLLGNHRLIESYPDVKLNLEKIVVYVPLTGGQPAVWSGLSRGQKNSVNRARRAGVEIRRVMPTQDNLEVFAKLYLKTMRRHGAARRWYFPPDHFANCIAELDKNRVSLFFAYIGGDVAAAHMLFHDFNTAYYQFGGSDDRFGESRASSLLVYEAAIWAGRQGYRQYFLGGGVSSSSDDKLLQFKAGFSDARAPLFTYGRVIDPVNYQDLSQRKRQHEMRQTGRESNSTYFPLYRR